MKLISPPKRNAEDPVPLEEAVYRQRNRIERLFAKLKGFRRVATCYAKLKETHLGLRHLVLGLIRLRSINNFNRAWIGGRGPGDDRLAPRGGWAVVEQVEQAVDLPFQLA